MSPLVPLLPSLWVDGLICLSLSPFICLPLSPSLDAPLGGRIHFGHSLSCGCWGQGPLSALHLDFDFAWARGGWSSLSIVGYTLSVRSVPRYQLRPLSVLARIWSPELTRAVRSGARLQLREGSVNPPVKQT